MTTTFIYKRGDLFSVTCTVDEHGFVTMHNITVPANTSAAIKNLFLEEAEVAAINLASNGEE